MTNPPLSVREYEVRAQTTNVFGRVLAGAREHHMVIDGPVQNGCPGEELTPVEVFLAAVASCGAELISVIAREESTALGGVTVRIKGTVDRSKQPRPDVTLFTRVDVDIDLAGADPARAAAMVEGFRRR